MDSIWKRIRQESNLPKHMIANKLGINEEKYDEIEKGERELPPKYIDKMMKIKHESKENKTEFALEAIKADNFIKNTDWEKLEKEFNYPMIKDLCKAMGIGISTYYHIRHNPELIAPKTKVKVYNFFMDPLNKYIDKNKTFNKNKTLIKFNNDGSIDTDWLLNRFGVTQIKLCDMLGIDSTCVSKWKCKKQMPRIETLEKIERLLQQKLSDCPVETIENNIVEEETIKEETISDITEDTMISNDACNTHEEEICELACACDVNDEISYTTNVDTYEEIVMDEKDYKIKELSDEIEKLQRTIRCYEKLIERL